MRSRLFICIALSILSAGSICGQTLGEITGRVSDASGAAVPGAGITLTNLATNATRTAVSTDSGDYTFPSVPPGFYSVKTEHAGFKTTTSNNVEVQVQQTVRFDISLQVGQVNESVEVSATADLLQAENAALGTVIENRGVNELPLNGRNYLSLVALSANVDTLSPASGQAGSREGGERASQSISAAGQRIMYDYFTLDGVVNTDPDFNTYVTLPSIDAIQEFKVQTGVYPAEFGHEATQINVLTKSGGNVYHGALFEFIRNDVFDAVPYAFGIQHPNKSPFKWNDYGFEVDGPIRIPKLLDLRNRLFFMANDEWKIQRQNSQALYTLPTAAEETGNLAGLLTPSGLPAVIYDPSTGNSTGAGKTTFQGNLIPSSRLDPISLKFLNYYAAATLATTINNYPLFVSSPLSRDAFTVRGDFVESSKSQWAFRYSWGSESQSSTGLGGVGSKILTNYSQYLGTNTRTLTPNLVNEARFGYTKLFNSIGTLSAFSNNVVAALGIPGLNPGASSTWGIPNISLNGDGFSGIGDSTDGPYVINDNTLQLVDNLSWIKGKHTVRFGFEFTRQNFDQVGNQFSRGNFVFQPNATQGPAKTGDAFAEFLLGDLYQSTVAVAIASANFQRNAEAAFADDTYKITPKVTISAGLRYELTPPWTDLLNNDFTVAIPHLFFAPGAPQSEWPYFVREGNCTNPYQGLSINWTNVAGVPGSQASPAPVCSNGMYPKQLMKTSYKDFAPRFSIAYSPDSKLVIRTGFGIFYSQDIGNAVFDMARNIAGRVTQTSTAGVPNLFYSNAVPGGNGAIAQIKPPFSYVDAYDHRTPYSMQYLFNIQRSFSQNWVFEAGYLGTVSHHLYGFQDANQAIPFGYIGNGTFSQVSTRLPFLNYGVIQLVQDGGNANYNAFSFKATRRFSQGVSVIGSYTWSKSIDDTSGIRTQGFDTLYPQNSDCIECERGLSSFDVRHRMVASLLYDLPFGKGRRFGVTNPFLNAVVGGWEVGGILTLQTGVPGTLSIGGVDNAVTSDGGYDRPNATGISPYLSNPTPSRWLNPAAFAEAKQGFFGNAGRDTIEGPGIANFDAQIHKQFRMPFNEHHNLQFRVEAFNSTNHPNWGMPNLNILANGNAFGTISSTQTAMRQVQIGLKYSF